MMTITSGGNTILGNNAGSAWSTASGRTTLEIYGSNFPMALHNSLSVGNSITYNTYWDGTNWRYVGATYSVIYIQDGEGHKFLHNGAGTAGGSFTPSEKMRITSGGNVCIGSTSAISTRQELRIGGNAAGSRISLGLNGTNFSALVTDSGGNVYLTNEYNDSAIKLLMINYNNGVYLSQSATSWTSNSDIRLKNIIGDITDAVSNLMTLRTIKFSWKHDNNNKENLGLIAQDVEKVLPQVMDKNKIIGSNDDTEYLGVRYQEIVPVLVKAIQELKSEIDTLKK
jgi:hypothetical protein